MPKTAIIPEVNLPVDAGRWNSVVADVLADNTWSYTWGTSNVDLDAGTYTIYAVSKPYDKTPETPLQSSIRDGFNHHQEALRLCNGIPINGSTG